MLADCPPATLRFVGGAELLGAIGLVLPAAVGAATVLRPTAGLGLAVLTLLAAAAHLRHGDARGVAVSVVLCAPAAVVSCGW